jgi:hypothetical protein
MELLELLRRRIKTEYIFPSEFSRTCAQLGLTKKESNKLLIKLEKTGKIETNSRWIKIKF